MKSIRILESNSEISEKILQLLLPMVSSFFKKAFEKTKNKLVILLQQAIVLSPEYSSIRSGILKAHFGLPKSEEVIDSIVNFYKKIDFTYNDPIISNNTIKGRFALNMVDSSFRDILVEDFASFYTEKGSKLNWLEWLLLFGDKTIVKDYSISLGAYPNSRTGLAIMKGQSTGKWKVPSSFSGNKNNNWITRAIDSIDPKIENILTTTLRETI